MTDKLYIDSLCEYIDVRALMLEVDLRAQKTLVRKLRL